MFTILFIFITAPLAINATLSANGYPNVLNELALNPYRVLTPLQHIVRIPVQVLFFLATFALLNPLYPIQSTHVSKQLYS